jgi:hypothetical protein
MSTHNRLFFRVIVERCDISLPSGHGTDGHDGAGCSTDVRTRSSFRTLCSQSQPGSEHKRQFSYSVYATLHTCGIFRVQSGIAFAHPPSTFMRTAFHCLTPQRPFFFLIIRFCLADRRSCKSNQAPTRKAQYAPTSRGPVKGTSDSN